MRLRMCTMVLGLAGFAWAPPAYADADVVLDAEGRTLRAASHVSRIGSVRIEMPPPAAVTMTCGVNSRTFKPGGLEMYVQQHAEVQDPSVLGRPKDSEIVEYRDGAFTVNPRGSGFLVYNVLLKKSMDTTGIDDCILEVQARTQRQATLKGEVEAKERDVARAERAVALRRVALESRQQDAASFAGISGAAGEVLKALEAVRTAREQAEAADADLDRAREELRLKVRERDDFPEATRKELGLALERAAYLLDAVRAGAVLKVGGLFVGGRREAVFYDFAARADNTTLQLSPLGDYPLITSDERVFAVIANVNRARHAYPFRLNASVSAGAPINVEPVRPSFEAAALDMETPKQPVSAQAYRDVFLSIRDAVPPNGNVEVTITTERPTAADPRKLETVTLVEKAKYPQFRARYRYNVSSGVFRSGLRDRQFVKVRTTPDDPATDKVNEARYRIDTLDREPQVRPVFSLSYYVFPVDIQSRVGWRDGLIPAPTLAFGFVKPQDNIFLGLTHEVWRNVQVFYGYHFGVTSEMVTRNVINEDEDETAPPTRERRAAKEFTWGLSFNLSAIAKVFK